METKKNIMGVVEERNGKVVFVTNPKLVAQYHPGLRENSAELAADDWGTPAYIRAAVAKAGCELDILVSDIDEFVRVEVAKKGYGVDKLVKDKSVYVRTALADSGFGLGTLLKDPDPVVRKAAEIKYGKMYGKEADTTGRI